MPREIVVMQNRATLVEQLVDHLARANVERERHEVLNDDELALTYRYSQFAQRRRRRGADGETLYDDVADPFTRNGSHVVTKVA